MARADSWCGAPTISWPGCAGCSTTTRPTTCWPTSRPTPSATAVSGRSRCGCPAGPPVGAPFGRRAELELDPKEYERALTAGLQYQQRLALPPGRYEVRLVARERGLVQQGGASQSVDVPDLKEKKLAMSGLFLSAAPAGGAATVETVAHRFKRGDSLSFQFYVYNPALDADGHSDVVLQAQVWSGGKATAASPGQPGPPPQ